jgi:hypothetical protein
MFKILMAFIAINSYDKEDPNWYLFSIIVSGDLLGG